jgi:uncharacterized protein YbjT (DUF2867 family)
MQVFLTGATGFVGSHVLRRLQAEGHQVRVLARARTVAAPLPERGGMPLEVIPGDVVEDIGLERGMDTAEAVIHLVGIIMETAGATFEKVHYLGTRNVVEAARKKGIKRFVHMSALGARPDGVSGYQTSKWKAEEEVRHSGLEHVILRPSIIFGPGDGFVTQMVQVMKSAPLLRPVVGHGHYRFRPIYIDNVADCFAQALTSDQARNRTLELVGPAELSLDEMLHAIADCAGVRKPAIHIPFPLMYLSAAVLGALLTRPPVTTDQLRMLREGSTADPGPMLETFKLKPVTFQEGLRKYLCPGGAS